MTPLLLALALAAAGPTPSALGHVAELASSQALDDLPPGKMVGVFVQAPTPELQQAAASMLVDAAKQKGVKAAVLVDAADGAAAEQRARTEGLEVLLRLRVGLEGTDLTLAGDRIGTWVNFWDGRTENRQLASAQVAARVPADAAALTLARVVLPSITPPTPAAPKLGVVPIARIPARVVALALVDADGDGRPELAALTPTELLVLRADGEVLARRDLSALPESSHPVREPCGGLVSPDGDKGHRLLYASANQARGEALFVDKAGLHPVGLLDATPLASGPSGLVTAVHAAGTNLFGPELKLGTVAHALDHPVVTVTANPRAGTPAFLAIFAEGQVQPLGPDFAPAGAPTPAGIAALADLDGNGTPELVLSGPQPLSTTDTVRVLEPGGAAPILQADVQGAIVAATAGDLDGDGKDEALLAALQPDGTTAILRVGLKP